MQQTQERPRNCAEDEELIDTLIAISVVSKRLARKLASLAAQSQFMISWLVRSYIVSVSIMSP